MIALFVKQIMNIMPNVFLILCNIRQASHIILWKACLFYYISSENDVRGDGDSDGCDGVHGDVRGLHEHLLSAWKSLLDF